MPAAKAAATEAKSAQVFPFPTFDITKLEMPKFDASLFDLSKFEAPAQFKEIAEKTLDQAKGAFAKLKTAAEEVTDVAQDAYATATAGAKDFNLTALSMAQANMNTGFEHARELFAVKTLSEVVQLQSAFLSKQFETMQGQVKDLAAIAQKSATDAVEPIKAKIEGLVAPAK